MQNSTNQNGIMIDSRYRLEKELGRAWLAVHTATGSRMVIKPREHFQDPRVIRHLSQLRHPALPRVIDEIKIGPPESEQTCLVTEFIEGETFSEWMQAAGGRLIPDQLIPLMAETARTLAFLHDQNEPRLLHLDLKPEHLVRMPNGHAGLIDFDCARLYPIEPISKSTIRCTVGYAAPELMTGTPGPETDIYALGVTMLVLLTGQSMTDQALPPLEPLCRYLPPAVTAIIKTCLNSDPARRYPSAAALACALENLLVQKHSLALVSPDQQPNPPDKHVPPDAAPAAMPTLPPVFQRAADPDRPRYPDQLIVIWDNACFAVKLAEHLTRSGNQTILIDADLLNPRIDLLLGLDKTLHRGLAQDGGHEHPGQTDETVSSGLDLALTALMRKTVPPERFPDLLQKTRQPNLTALTGQYRLREYEYYDADTLLALLHLARMHADVVLVRCSRFIHDSFTCLSILAADLVLIPVTADPGSIREYNRYLDFLAGQYPFDRRKARFVAIDYDPERHLSWGMTDELCDGLLAGCIPRKMSRSGRRFSLKKNQNTGSQAVADEYDQLLRRLGFARHPSVSA